MKNKKTVIYIVLLTTGILLGWLLFGSKSKIETVHQHEKVSTKNQMWTCSMHPQIMQPEPGDCPICGMDLIPAETGTDGLAVNQFKLTKNAMALANIQTTIVGNGKIGDNNSIKLSGKITENENETATQPAHFNGRIEALYVKSLGEYVVKGQPVAEVYSPELIAAQQELITAYKLKATQPELYNAVKNKFKNWMIHGSQLDVIEQTGQVKTRFIIYAHVSGIVTEILVNIGAHIMDGKAIFKVANLNTVWANFDVYENQISQFKKGQNITITTKAYPNKTFKGKVDFIDPVLNAQTRTVTLRVVLNNKNGIFKPGMFVQGKVLSLSTKSNQVLTIPSTAVLWTGKRSIVYVKTNPENPIFEMREVVLGNQNSGFYKVFEGLTNGDEIVVNGTFTVDAAAQLSGKKSMMNQSGDKISVGHEHHQMKSEKVISKPFEEVVDTKFQSQLREVFQVYDKLKKSLINDNVDEVAKNAGAFILMLKKVDMKLLKDDKSHSIWMPLQKDMSDLAQRIATGKNIENQRKYFMDLSNQLKQSIVAFGIGKTVYSQSCPMVNNNQGGIWLSFEKEIVNPYFGGEMIACGSIEQVLE